MTDLPSQAAAAGNDAEPRLARLEIFVDGSNFYTMLRGSYLQDKIDIPRFARELARTGPQYVLVKLNYYTAPSPVDETRRRQDRFFEELRLSSTVRLVLGRHERRGEVNVEKETDVNLAVDMVVGAYEDRYDVAMLVTGDTDQVRAVTAVRDLGKPVIWGHFAPQQHSDHLRQVCSEAFLFSEHFMRKCIRPAPGR